MDWTSGSPDIFTKLLLEVSVRFAIGKIVSSGSFSVDVELVSVEEVELPVSSPEVWVVLPTWVLSEVVASLGSWLEESDIVLLFPTCSPVWLRVSVLFEDDDEDEEEEAADSPDEVEFCALAFMATLETRDSNKTTIRANESDSFRAAVVRSGVPPLPPRGICRLVMKLL
ncbi:hypothetical protein [Nitrososphaera viennensis]|uniref:Uncharacterized protein n=1 Tax=Nitrososphaera viennensis TaxID=1034015 RepID=A0A977IDJ1_9ARCH|nr:hypothetical protein [Nitrososphaera viennensis]UVS68827.1 hypothetical protein NWT39_13080 [Nitrososphaera viennensis]